MHDLTSELFSSKFAGRDRLMSAIRFSERASFRFATEVLTVHESYADMLRGFTKTRVTTVMNCPDDKLSGRGRSRTGRRQARSPSGTTA